MVNGEGLMDTRPCRYLGRIPGDDQKDRIRSYRDGFLASIADGAQEVMGHFAAWVCVKCDRIVWVHSEVVYGSGELHESLAQSPGCVFCAPEVFARQREEIDRMWAIFVRAANESRAACLRAVPA